ncbi:MAG: hypothetical protein RLY30_1892 [Pseudomonadota bacterium]|jgi:HAD superfamily hydrolase (TIGR01509 family)
MSGLETSLTTLLPAGLRAVLFDVDGTLAETEQEGHLPAFNEAFESLDIPWVWTDEDYAWLLKTTGGLERMRVYAEHLGQSQWLAGEGADRLKSAHQLKNKLYAHRVAHGFVHPRPGVVEWIQSLTEAGIEWSVVTTTSRANFDALFNDCLKPRGIPPFKIAVCGEDVQDKKPHPEAYLQALSRLGLAASDCMAVEDAPNGLKAAQGAGLRCLVVRSVYFKQAEFSGAWADRESFLP